jgi:hypothetical protein
MCSPLLRLPAEIRTRIYELVLPQNKTMLIEDHWDKNPSTIPTCNPPTIPAYNPPTIRAYNPPTRRTHNPSTRRTYNSRNPSTIRTYDPSTRRIYDPPTTNETSPRVRRTYGTWRGPRRAHDEQRFNMLLVCKQVYFEACLLPFQGNIFKFDLYDSSRTKPWLDNLKSWQRSAIEQVEATILFFWTARGMSVDRNVCLDCLGLNGVKHLHYNVKYFDESPGCLASLERYRTTKIKSLEKAYPGLKVTMIWEKDP